MTQEESKLRECYRHIWVQAKELLKENDPIEVQKAIYRQMLDLRSPTGGSFHLSDYLEKKSAEIETEKVADKKVKNKKG